VNKRISPLVHPIFSSGVAAFQVIVGLAATTAERNIMNISFSKTRGALLTMAAICAGLTSTLSACPVPGASGAGFNASALLASRAMALRQAVAAPKVDADAVDSNSRLDIVGMWELTQTVGGQLFDHALQQFSSDGNEVQNSGVVPPGLGNLCFGVWVRTGNRTFHLKHYGWDFDAQGNFTGTFFLEADMTMTDGDTYTGKFVTDTILPSGQKDPSLHAEGTIAAKRIALH
jgi:hypothetical protein